MENYQELIGIIAMTMGVGWASGINLYAALLVLGIAANTGNLVLPEELLVLQDPMVIGAAGLMYFVEFFADKTPGVDTGWDTIHTFIRIPAGALLAAGAVGDVTPALEIAAGIMGGSMATASHVTKASSRALINTSPEPLSNWSASIAEDLMVFGGMWTMLNYPVLFVVLMVIFIALVIWLLPKIWRALKLVFRRIKEWFSGTGSLQDTQVQAGNAAALSVEGYSAEGRSLVAEEAVTEEVSPEKSVPEEQDNPENQTTN